MPSNQPFTRLHSDSTQYAEYTDNGANAYCESLFPAGFHRVDERSAPESRWPRVVLLAGVGLIAAFLVAFLTLQMVRHPQPAQSPPSGVDANPVTTVITERQAPQPNPTTVTVAPTATRSPVTTTAAPPPPATMTNPLEPPPATMTNPLEPPPGAFGSVD